MMLEQQKANNQMCLQAMTNLFHAVIPQSTSYQPWVTPGPFVPQQGLATSGPPPPDQAQPLAMSFFLGDVHRDFFEL